MSGLLIGSTHTQRIGSNRMTTIAEREAKAERIEIRVTPNAKALLTAAAQSRHTTVSEFLLTHGIAAAEQALAVPRVFYASDEGWAAIRRLLEEEEVERPNSKAVSWLAQGRISEK